MAESPRELAADADAPIPSEGSTLPLQPTAEEPAEKAVEPAEGLDAMPSNDKKTKPTSSLSQAAMATIDAMEIEQSTNLPDHTPSGESNPQIASRSDQGKADVVARHRAALKDIWARRVL